MPHLETILEKEHYAGSEESSEHCKPSFDTSCHLESQQSHSSDTTLTTDAVHSDGGLRGWLTVLGAFTALFCTFGQMNAFGTFQTFYATHQLRHLPPSTISWIGSVQLWVFFFSGAPIGCLFDVYGPRMIVSAGTIVFVFSLCMTSIATQYYQLILCQGVLFGLGVGMMFYPCLAAVSTHFTRYRATALGISMAGSGLGGVVYPILLTRLFDTVGFGWTVRVSAAISALCCTVAVCTVTRRQSPTRSMRSCFDSSVFKDGCYMLLVAGSIFVALGLFIPFFYIVEYAGHIGISHNTEFYVLTALNAGGVLGRVLPAYIADIIGNFNLLTPCAFFAGLSCLVFWMFAASLVPLVIFAAMYGFFAGAFISVVMPCVAQISKIDVIGTRIGILYSLISFPSLVGGPVAGILLVRARGSYTGMIVFSGTTILVGSLFFLAARLYSKRRPLARV